MRRHQLTATVKAAPGDDGTFTAVASMPTLDRDGEVITAGAFNPLPETIPVHAYHDFNDPVGRGRPFYDGQTLMIEGRFAKTPRAQEIRSLVVDGVIGHMSVGFMGAARNDQDGVPTITKAELLEISFVSVPSNREAAILESRSVKASRGSDAATARVRALTSVAEAELLLSDLKRRQNRQLRPATTPRDAVAQARRLLRQIDRTT